MSQVLVYAVCCRIWPNVIDFDVCESWDVSCPGHISGRVLSGVSPWVTNGQGVYVIVCHRFRYHVVLVYILESRGMHVTGPSVYGSQSVI